MSKRRATDELYPTDSKRQDAQVDRVAEFTAHLRALNSQFAQWVQQQAAQCGDQLWSDGVKDYMRYADKLLEDYEDVIRNGKQASPPLASNLFGTPAPAANGSADADALTACSTGAAGSSGRKSVTFAPNPSFSSGAAGIAATPGVSNNANAGHTPAPASGLGFTFAATPGATPAAAGGAAGGGAELPSPEPFKLGSVTPGSLAGFGGGGTVTPSTTGFTFGAAGNNSSGPAASTSGTPIAAADGFGTPVTGLGAAAAPAPAAKGFMFGASTSSTPGSGTGADAAAAGASISGPGGFTIGGSSAAAGITGAGAVAAASAPSTSGFSFGAAPAASSSGPSTFSFGALPSSSGTAGGSSSSPAFGFATTAAGGASTAAGGASTSGGMFNFPAPAAAAAAGAAGGDEAGEDEGPPKYKPEIKVDENVWKVFFSSKARLHVRVKKEGGAIDWEPRGVGMLTVRQPKEGQGSVKTYVMFSTDVGKQLVSSQLMSNSAVMAFPNNPKKCRMSLMVLQYDLPPARTDENSAASQGPKHMLQVCMISLSTAEKVEELSKVVEQHKPK